MQQKQCRYGFLPFPDDILNLADSSLQSLEELMKWH